MINAIQIAVAGLNAASRQAEKAAATIAAIPALPSASENPPAGGPSPPLLRPGSILPAADDLTGALVDLQTASVVYQANLKTVQIVSAMQNDLIKGFDRKS